MLLLLRHIVQKYVFFTTAGPGDPPRPSSPGHPVVGPDSVARSVARSKHGGQAFGEAGRCQGRRLEPRPGCTL